MFEYHIVDPTSSIERLVMKLQETSHAPLNLGPPLKVIVQDILTIEDQIFTSKGRRGGGSWKKLADRTIQNKGHDTILRDTDDLYNSLTWIGAKYQVLKIDKDSLEFGTTRPYAQIHQMGSADGKIRARPFIRYMPEDLAKWNNVLTAHILKAFQWGAEGPRAF